MDFYDGNEGVYGKIESSEMECRLQKGYINSKSYVASQSTGRVQKTQLKSQDDDQQQTIQQLKDEIDKLRREKQYILGLHENQLNRMRDFYENTIESLVKSYRQPDSDSNFKFQQGDPYYYWGQSAINQSDLAKDGQISIPALYQHQWNHETKEDGITSSHVRRLHDNQQSFQTQSSASQQNTGYISDKIRHPPTDLLAIDFYGNKIGTETSKAESVSDGKNITGGLTDDPANHFEKLESTLQHTMRKLKTSLRCRKQMGEITPSESLTALRSSYFSSTLDRIPLEMTYRVNIDSVPSERQCLNDKYASTVGRVIKSSKSRWATDKCSGTDRGPLLTKPLRPSSGKTYQMLRIR